MKIPSNMVYQPALFYLQGFLRFTKASSKTRELQYIFTRWIRSLFVSSGLAKTPTSPKIHSLVLFHVSYRGTLNINPCIFTYLMMQLNIQHRMPSDFLLISPQTCCLQPFHRSFHTSSALCLFMQIVLQCT